MSYLCEFPLEKRRVGWALRREGDTPKKLTTPDLVVEEDAKELHDKLIDILHKK